MKKEQPEHTPLVEAQRYLFQLAEEACERKDIHAVSYLVIEARKLYGVMRRIDRMQS